VKVSSGGKEKPDAKNRTPNLKNRTIQQRKQSKKREICHITFF